MTEMLIEVIFQASISSTLDWLEQMISQVLAVPL